MRPGSPALPGSNGQIFAHCAPSNSYRFADIIRSVQITEPYESAIKPLGNPECRSVLADGVLLNSPQPDALRFMPALNVSKSEIGQMIDCLDSILTRMGAARRVA